MPDFTPSRVDAAEALETLLPALFRRLQSEPAPEGLIDLIDRLEAAYARPRTDFRVNGETRVIAQAQFETA